MSIRLVFDFCFKYETLIRFDSGQRTHHDLVLFRLGVQWYQPLYLMNVFLPPAGFRPRGRNPRRHPNVPRVKNKYRIVLLVVCQTFPIWWNWARTVVPVNFQHVRGSAIAQTGFVNESHSPYCVAHKHNKWRTRNRGVEGTSMSTAKATPTTTDRGTGDWNQRNYDGFTLSKTQIS